MDWVHEFCKCFVFGHTIRRQYDKGENITVDGIRIANVLVQLFDINLAAVQTLVLDTDYTIEKKTYGINICIDSKFEYVVDTKLTVTLNVGYTLVPESVRVAALLKFSSLYNNRDETVQERLTAAEKLLIPHKIYDLM
jgi:uncharacterized membrane protein